MNKDWSTQIEKLYPLNTSTSFPNYPSLTGTSWPSTSSPQAIDLEVSDLILISNKGDIIEVDVIDIRGRHYCKVRTLDENPKEFWIERTYILELLEKSKMRKIKKILE
jgi:hypothetical protein